MILLWLYLKLSELLHWKWLNKQIKDVIKLNECDKNGKTRNK
jgi:hypothetical protein